MATEERAREDFYEALLEDDPQALYDSAPCGYLSTAADGTIVKVNRTFLTLTGYAEDDLIRRRTFSELLSTGGRIYHETHYAPMLRMQGTAREIALEIITADGRRIPVLVNSVLERDASGEPRVIRTAVFDATERRKYERELLLAKDRAEKSEARASSLARTLQQTLIPPTPPEIPNLDVAAAYRPAGSGVEVGGDFYDIFQIGKDDWVLTLGDVCGKGAEAAAVTALMRHTIRALSVSFSRPTLVLHALNEVMLKQGTDRFCTAVLVRIRCRRGDWIAQVASAGHPLPVLVSVDGRAGYFGAAGDLLGVLEAPEFSDEKRRLDPGEALVLYTDGVTEARRGDLFYGEDKLLEVVAAEPGSATEITDRVISDVLEFQEDVPRDDIALVTVKVPESKKRLD